MPTTPELIDYIRQQLASGTAREQLVTTLLTQGWQQADLDEAFAAASGAPKPPAPPTPQQAAQLASLDEMASRPAMPGAVALTKDAFALFRVSVWRLLGLSLLGVLGMGAALIAVMTLYAIANLVGNATGSIVVMQVLRSVLGLVGIVVIVGGMMWLTVASYVYILRADMASGIRAAFGAARPHIIPFLWLGLLQGAVTLGGTMLLLFGALTFGIWMCFAQFVLLDEGIRGMQAIVKSRELVRGRWWRTLGYISFLYLISIVATIVISIIASIIDDSGIVNGVLSGIFNFFFAPFALCYMTVFYRHMKASRGVISPFPKPGQMKWYWIVALLGPIMAAVGGLVFAAIARVSGGAFGN
jgi:hypothetical protein